MAFLIVFVLAFVLALVLQRLGKPLSVCIAVPIVCFVAFVLFDAYVLPYRGGGASMWPVAILFGAPVVAVAGALGFAVGHKAGKAGKAD